MENKITYDQLILPIKQHFLPVLTKKLNTHIEFVHQIHQLQNKFIHGVQGVDNEPQLKIIQKVYKLELSKLIKKTLFKSEQKSFDEQFPLFVFNLEKRLNKLPLTLTLPQHEDRFKIQTDDTLQISFLKFFKRIGFGTSKTFLQSDTQVWTHDVAYRNICKFYLKEHLSQRLITLINSINRAKNKATELMWEVDKTLNGINLTNSDEEKETIINFLNDNYQNALSILNDERDQLMPRIEKLTKITFRDCAIDLRKAGTIELSNESFSEEILERKHKILNNSVLKLDKEWANTTEVLGDDWYLELEIQLIQYLAEVELEKTQKTIHQKIRTPTTEHIEKLNIDYLLAKQGVLDATTKAQLIEELSNVDLSRKLSEDSNSLLKTCDSLLYSKLPELINKVESFIDNSINHISKETSVCSNEDYLHPIPDSEITYSSIQEIMRFTAWKDYQKSSKEVKSEITEQIIEIRNVLVNQGQIEEFNKSTRAEIINGSEKLATEDNPTTVVLEGLERSLDNLKLLNAKLDALFDNIQKKLPEAIAIFNQKVQGLSEDENITAIRLKITANEALEKSHKIKNKTKDAINNFVPVALAKSRDIYNKSLLFIKDIQKSIGIEGTTENMDLTIADFLTTKVQSYEKLPFIYKRLFHDEPLEEDTYFVGRSKETEGLKTALSRFQSNHYSTAIVLGEKGAGITSLLNQFQKITNYQNPIIRVNVQESLHTQKDFYKYLSTTLAHEVTNLEEAADHLNSLKKSVFIIENVQLLFLKKIGGFKVLKDLGELISITSSNVFWLLGCYTYSYNYLNKSIGFSENFRYEIKLEEFTNEIMTNIIKQRHMVSGYSTTFVPSYQNLKSKKFNNLTKKAQQEYLENQYFTELNNMAKGNIRIALSYWLSSLREVPGNTLNVSSMQKFDLSFIRNLPENSLYILGTLIQHDKLKIDALKDVMNMKKANVRRRIHTLIEFGLILESEDYFLVNPLLYRQCLTILKAKNIIH